MSLLDSKNFLVKWIYFQFCVGFSLFLVEVTQNYYHKITEKQSQKYLGTLCTGVINREPKFNPLHSSRISCAFLKVENSVLFFSHS